MYVSVRFSLCISLRISRERIERSIELYRCGKCAIASCCFNVFIVIREVDVRTNAEIFIEWITKIRCRCRRRTVWMIRIYSISLTARLQKWSSYRVGEIDLELNKGNVECGWLIGVWSQIDLCLFQNQSFEADSITWFAAGKCPSFGSEKLKFRIISVRSARPLICRSPLRSM